MLLLHAGERAGGLLAASSSRCTFAKAGAHPGSWVYQMEESNCSLQQPPPPSSLLSPPERYDVEKVRQTGEDQSLPPADDKDLAEMAKASFHATGLGKTDSNRKAGKGMGGESRGRKERPRKEQKVGRMT